MAKSDGGSGRFATTRWSMVQAAGAKPSPETERALADLCQRYWFPLYVYVRRRIGNVEEARDLTQEFFARLLERKIIARADPQRGRFRSFLLTSLQHFLANEWQKQRTQKRGGAQRRLPLDFDSKDSQVSVEPAHDWTAERLFERQWALTLLDGVLADLRQEYEAAGRTRWFEQLKPFLAGDTKTAPYADAAAALQVSEGAVRVAAHRLRKRYRELLRREVAQTVADDADVEDEIRALFAAVTPA
jgi:RNA polymerase sigma-70 factor (ECF subfamily)